MPKKGRKAGGRNTKQSRGTQTTGTVMKKVGKKGAYKRNVKNQMVMRRAPIVETKQRVHSDVALINGFLPGNLPLASGGNIVNPLNWRTLSLDDAFTNVPLRSWQRNTHGFGELNVIGNSIFSKYLNFKLQVRFPRGEQLALPVPDTTPPEFYNATNVMIQVPTKLYLICGWITESMNYPVANVNSPSLPPQSDASYEAINTYITQQLKPFFDDDEDKLQFRPKETTNIKIESYRKIAPNLDKAIATQAVPEHQFADSSVNIVDVKPHGSVPDVYRSHSFKTNRKIALTQGADTSFTTDKQNLYPNNSWIPFAVIYNPDYEQQLTQWKPLDGKPNQFEKVCAMEYRWNDAHYFTDS
ncbi:MAG: putative capsid protein [Cressdnaviricota sp.]|nr:MAG: putative capsid protein [Cressdnaviricota sp.]